MDQILKRSSHFTEKVVRRCVFPLHVAKCHRLSFPFIQSSNFLPKCQVLFPLLTFALASVGSMSTLLVHVLLEVTG